MRQENVNFFRDFREALLRRLEASGESHSHTYLSVRDNAFIAENVVPAYNRRT